MQNFSFIELDLSGAFLIKPFASFDFRGGLIKDYSQSVFSNNGINYELKEVFYTISHRGVLRALHFQEVNQQPKLVRCISGKIYDVLVDLRPSSPTFGKWVGMYLSGENMNELLIPANFAHGYLVIEDSIVSYKCSELFDAKNDSGIMFNDSDIGVKWPFEDVGGFDNVIISDKDRHLQTLKENSKKGCK